MKKIISLLLCLVLISGCFGVCASAKTETTEGATEGEFVLTLDVNKRYTDIVEDTDGLTDDDDDSSSAKISDSKKPVYIGVLVAALVVSVVILAVSLKRVPPEEKIDVSGTGKTKKDEEE